MICSQQYLFTDIITLIILAIIIKKKKKLFGKKLSGHNIILYLNCRNHSF